MTDVPHPTTRPSDFLVCQSSIPKKLFCSEYNFNDGPHYSTRAQGIASTDHLTRAFPSDPYVFRKDIRDHIIRKMEQGQQKSKPWSKSHFITLYESKRLAEDEVVQLSVVEGDNTENGKLVNNTVRFVEDRSKPGFKVYQVSGRKLAAANVCIIKASDVIQGCFPGQNQTVIDHMRFHNSEVYEDEYWVWGLVPANSVKRAFSFKSIFAARMRELDENEYISEDDEPFHDTVEKQVDEMEGRVKLRGGASSIHEHDLHRSSRGVAQVTQKTTSKPGKQSMDWTAEDYDNNNEDVEDDDDSDDEDIPAVATPKHTKISTRATLTARPNVTTRSATASQPPNASQSSSSAPVALPSTPKVNYGRGPLPGGMWKVKDVLNHRWATDENGRLLKNRAQNPYFEYLVKWDGVGKNKEKWSEDKYDSWEPSRHFPRSKVLNDYWKGVEGGKPMSPEEEDEDGGDQDAF